MTTTIGSSRRSRSSIGTRRHHARPGPVARFHHAAMKSTRNGMSMNGR
jgi:hypothetical protein